MDIDIILIDTKIQQHFLEEYGKIDKYKEIFRELENLLNSVEIDKNIKHRIEDEYKICKERLEDLIVMTSYNFYIVESVPIIESYKKILRTPLKISFFSVPESATPNEKKENLVSAYIQIAKKYLKNIDMDIDFTIKAKKVVCDNCNSKKVITSENIFLICQDCGYEKDLNGTKISYKDISRTTILQKYTYERRSHFRDCINQFQGKQICKLEPDLDKLLEQEFEKHHMLIGDITTVREIRYKNVELEHVMLFLKELGYDKQYDNAKYIYSIITGKKWPDLSHLEDQLMSDFDVLVNAYVKKYKYENKIARKSFMNIQYVLFQLLNKNKYPCRKEDFNILKTNDRKTFHDDIAKSLFEELGWNHVALF